MPFYIHVGDKMIIRRAFDQRRFANPSDESLASVVDTVVVLKLKDEILPLLNVGDINCPRREKTMQFC